MSLVKLDSDNTEYLSVNLYIQMEYCAGDTLHKMIEDRKKNNRTQNYNIISQLVLGVTSIHRKGIVHRDLKPQNIFFSEEVIKIGDFGLAK